ncbi:MAG TPA: glycoside hydrolase family 92 protein, partial [Rhodothermia bacterium]
GDMVQTMIDMYVENGWLPKWELGANETYLMVGDAAAIVVADSYVKGIRSFDVEKAFEAIVKATTVSADGDAPLIRPGYHDLVLGGYIPADQDTTEEWWVWGPVSTMLEYNLTDAAAAIMADSLGRTDVAARLRARSLTYRHYFDPETRFLRPKNRNGEWLTPFDPLATEGSGYWEGSGGPGYVEGNAWNYTWFVPHDMHGLAELFGGTDAMLDKLEECFANGTFDSTNEPDIGYPYTFAQVGSRVHRTPELVRSIMHGDFSTGPSGLPGNDDAGAISAWYVFSALGFYPFFTGSPEYVLGMPAFDQVTLTIPQPGGGQQTLEIERSGIPESGTVYFNGEKVGTSIGHGRVIEGGRLVFGAD